LKLNSCFSEGGYQKHKRKRDQTFRGKEKEFEKRSNARKI